MNQKSFMRLAAAIFAVVALAHLVRAAMALPISIACWIVPMWLSWVAFVIAGALSWFGWSLAKREAR